MTPEQIVLVQQSFEQIAPNADRVAELFYERLFKLDRSLRALFRNDMEAQGRALMGMVRVAVHGLDRLETILPSVQALGVRHVAYGVKDEDYDTVGSALLWTLEQNLGPAFTDDVRAAWAAAYTLLADTMKLAAAK